MRRYTYVGKRTIIITRDTYCHLDGSKEVAQTQFEKKKVILVSLIWIMKE